MANESVCPLFHVTAVPSYMAVLDRPQSSADHCKTEYAFYPFYHVDFQIPHWRLAMISCVHKCFWLEVNFN